MTIHSGENVLDGITVLVERKSVKNINLRVKPDGLVKMTVPCRATLAQGAAFLASKWEWVRRMRERLKARQKPQQREIPPMEYARLQTLLAELHSFWAAKVGEFGIAWKIRKMKTRWGVCNWVKRQITYSENLVGQPRDVVEYIVCHEFCHFAVHGHGTRFHALMDKRLPDLRERRKRLNHPEQFSGESTNGKDT